MFHFEFMFLCSFVQALFAKEANKKTDCSDYFAWYCNPEMLKTIAFRIHWYTEKMQIERNKLKDF